MDQQLTLILPERTVLQGSKGGTTHSAWNDALLEFMAHRALKPRLIIQYRSNTIGIIVYRSIHLEALGSKPRYER